MTNSVLKKMKRGKVLWRKRIFDEKFICVDSWGVSGDPKYKYEVYVTVDRVFSLRDGFMYQVRIPNFLVNRKRLVDAFYDVISYLCRGGAPCYFRLEDELMAKKLFHSLGS